MVDDVQEIDLSFLDDIDDQSLEDIVGALQDDCESYADAIGFGPDALCAIEHIALGYYRGRQHERAAVIYGFILRLDPTYAAAWRGLGACCQARREHVLAVDCYLQAIAHDPSDVVSAVFSGESLCMIGDREQGLTILNKVLEVGTENPAYLPYVTRARAIIAADGGVPSRIVLVKEGQKLVREVTEEMVQVLVEFDEGREVELEDIMRNPKLSAEFRDIAEALKQGRLTYAQVGGFTDNELDGAYAAACQYVELGQVIEAMQICGYLMMLDSYNGRYYQLVGICLQRLKQYEAAIHYYRMALVNDPGEPMSLVYQGECVIMSGEVDAGLVLVRQGAEACSADPDDAPVADRAKQLMLQFG